jgi:hypothetical protein
MYGLTPLTQVFKRTYNKKSTALELDGGPVALAGRLVKQDITLISEYIIAYSVFLVRAVQRDLPYHA